MAENGTHSENYSGVIASTLKVPISSNDEVSLQGQLSIPSSGAKALVIFAHGSGSGKDSPRNQRVAKALNGFGFATLLVDLLTPEEQESDIKSQKIVSKIPGLILNKFNIRLLSNRLIIIINWILDNVSEVRRLPIGYFGASTGAAAAIEASVLLDQVFIIVFTDSRPYLAGRGNDKSQCSA